MAGLLTNGPGPRTVALALIGLVGIAATACGGPVGAVDASEGEVRILAGEPTTMDPAAQGDIGSAAVSAQLFESVTAFDPSLTVRPALAASWDIVDGGRRIVFHLREGLTFSDGTPIAGDDVVRSWLRVIDPASPSPLASLMIDVEGAAEHLAGSIGEEEVGLSANGLDVEVRLVRPASDFVAVVAGPTFAIVPEGLNPGAPVDDDGFVGSGAYILSDIPSTGLTLSANERYWAGPPPIATIHLVSDIGGQTILNAFDAGDLDYASVGSFDAAWIRYDETYGPLLREVPSMSTQYLGFNTSQPPFDDPLVRRAFGQAVDWQRIVALATPIDATPANSLVPPGIPGRSDRNFLPAYDPDAARAALAEAGFPDGDGFPEVTYLDSGNAYAAGMLADLERELGIDVTYETTDFGTYIARLGTDTPHIWSMGWVADYPGRNDFLGVLLRTGQSNNYGRWSNADFDAAIAEAGAATDEATANAAYDRAEEIVQAEVPVVPLAYGPGWAISREGLLGASQNGLGILRMAGLAWADE